MQQLSRCRLPYSRIQHRLLPLPALLQARAVIKIQVALLALSAAAAASTASTPGAAIDNAALSNEQDGRDWPAYGRTFSEGHFSPLSQINAANVSRLGLAWSLDLDVTNSITAPLEVGGVVYVGAGYGVVYAVEAVSGKLLWRYDSHAPDVAGKKLRLNWGIRGLAFWKGRVYAGTVDGRLLALNAADGKLLWSVQTVDRDNGAVITGAPRAFNGKIIIGFSGEDFGPLRGYVTAYDAQTGRQAWRFYLVPGKPGTVDHAASDDALKMAARTWTGEWWKYGGGGAVWNAITYDPDFNRIYLGTGNGSPMNWKLRSPSGGDNLFIASVVAVDADDGHYLWHYQTTPGDSWDYDSSTDMTLATLQIDGRARKVLLHAAKNGFFYVIDRIDGHLISAQKLGTVTWADHIDLKTGRPVEVPGARYKDRPALLWPSFEAVHHWIPQAYDPLTALMYEPTLEMPATFGDQGVDLKHWQPRKLTPEYSGLSIGDGDVPADAGHSVLKAWDPIASKVIWQVETPGISNGGVLASAGDLVIEGLADGYLHAYSARTGKDLWSFFCGVAVTGVPITYRVGDKQYITITSGPLGGASAAFGSIAARWGWDARIHPKRLLTFAVDASAKLPPTPPRSPAVPLVAPEFHVDPAKVSAGAQEYSRCTLCHGMGVVAGGIAPDLRASPVPLSRDAFAHVVREGALRERGMPAFQELTDEQLDSLRHFVRQKARDSASPTQKHTELQ
jgi:quinohemoprotein ethanol dehydrogenase